ncbi:MAG: hypothetical protein HQK99_14410 [Nitrospirae bacterium]|nr:hypothetical protein [Nitrospirota bacterium]
MKRTVNVFYLCVMITILGLLHTSASNQCYGDNNTPQNILLKEYTSPEGNIIVRHIVDVKKGDLEIWLYSSKNPSKGELLRSYEIDADVLFSYDETWLVLNDRYGSTDTDPILFKRVKGLKYEEIENLYGKAWDLFEKTHKKYKALVFKKYKRKLVTVHA